MRITSFEQHNQNHTLRGNKCLLDVQN
jgi:hypothetical protein